VCPLWAGAFQPDENFPDSFYRAVAFKMNGGLRLAAFEKSGLSWLLHSLCYGSTVFGPTRGRDADGSPAKIAEGEAFARPQLCQNLLAAVPDLVLQDLFGEMPAQSVGKLLEIGDQVCLAIDKMRRKFKRF
jgi:hypothetical protein